jgi:Cof subfamily protein (haloacid dehalogenase superfamily)
MIKLITTDMDGTLLTDKSILPEGFFDVCNKLVNKGIQFVIASGRQYYTLLNNMKPVKDKICFIAENGSLIAKKGNFLYLRAMDKRIAKSVISDARKVENCDIVLCCKNSAYIEVENDEFIYEARKYYHRCRKVEDLLSVNDDILKIAVYDYIGAENNTYKQLSSQWSCDLNITISGMHWLDFAPHDVNKGLALKRIQSVLGISPEETLVFGDYFNDVPMMKAAYYSYAMQNAPDGVKKEARFCAPTNNEAGVLKVISDLEAKGLI